MDVAGHDFSVFFKLTKLDVFVRVLSCFVPADHQQPFGWMLIGDLTSGDELLKLYY